MSRREKFSIRKSHRGTVSTCIAILSLFSLTMMNQEVGADELSSVVNETVVTNELGANSAGKVIATEQQIDDADEAVRQAEIAVSETQSAISAQESLVSDAIANVEHYSELVTGIENEISAVESITTDDSVSAKDYALATLNTASEEVHQASAEVNSLVQQIEDANNAGSVSETYTTEQIVNYTDSQLAYYDSGKLNNKTEDGTPYMLRPIVAEGVLNMIWESLRRLLQIILIWNSSRVR